MTVALRNQETSRDAGRVTSPARVGVSERFGSAFRVGRSALAESGRRAESIDLVAHPPASLAQLIARTRQGGWVPGDQPWFVEAPGYAYGWLVAVPVSAVLYALAWVLQRPSRLLVAVVVTLLMVVCW